MPSVVLDTDSKYQNMLDNFLALNNEKFAGKNLESRNPECKIFDNVLESLVWLTKSQDQSLLGQLNKSRQTSENDIDNFPIEIKDSEKINVLITGSLYLVGLSLKVLDFKID